jgi:hypothetical protein
LGMCIVLILGIVVPFSGFVPPGASATEPASYKSLVESLMLFGLSVAGSLSLTLFALYIGHLARPSAWIPQTTQMLVSNTLFDGLTVVATLSILESAVQPRKRFPMLAAVLMDAALGGFFACASLWCGLAFTANALSFREVGRVFIARSVNGTNFELGPYFWAMHSTFLPLACFLCLILICWIVKITLIFVRWCLHRAGHEDINPFGMAASFIALLGAIIAALAPDIADYFD